MKIQEYISKNHLNESNSVVICLTIWHYDETLNGKQKIDLLLQLFDRNPECGAILELSMFNNEMAASEKNVMWNYFRKQLSKGDSIQRENIERSLWLGFFEDSEIVNEAWKKLVGDYQDENILKRLLKISSPVPFDLKDSLYQKIIKNKKWHNSIFESLEYGFFLSHGTINIKRARIILPTLKIDKTTSRYIKLEDNLKRFSSKAEYWNSLNKENDPNWYNPH